MHSFKGIARGDIIRHISEQNKSYLVNSNLGDRLIVSRVLDVTNPAEWESVCKNCGRVKS